MVAAGNTQEGTVCSSHNLMSKTKGVQVSCFNNHYLEVQEVNDVNDICRLQ
eukprot:m.226503 g.226503  ORF g.226503 m.226503 type:complete len:51 (-) comp15965_c0_seq5:94-246(-)